MPDIELTVAAERPPSWDIEAGAAPIAAAPKRRSILRADLGTRSRIAAIVGLSIVAFHASYARVGVDAVAGSPAAYVIVVPVLAALIATGYRSAPRGVGDSESDWIISTLCGIGGFTGILLLSERMPTLAGLWRLDLVGIVVWFTCASAVMFSVRRVAQLWTVWLFALCCATPLPYLLATAALGGSETAGALLAAILGAIAVFLAGRYAPLRRRVLAALCALVVAAGFVVAASGHVDPLLVVVVVGGVLPVIAVAALGVAAPGPAGVATPGIGNTRPHRSPMSLAVLTAVAALLLAVNPSPVGAPAWATAPTDWVQRAGLTASASYEFISRFLGPGATLTRYGVAARPGFPAAAVDVMTTDNRAAIDVFADAVWYPTSRPIDYRPAGPSDAMPLGARVIHSNADTATDGAGRDWYAVTWTWRVDHLSQRVTVIVSQSIGGDQSPPSPGPLSVFDTAVRPAKWLARQQPDSIGRVDPLVSERATEVVALLAQRGAIADKVSTGD